MISNPCFSVFTLALGAGARVRLYRTSEDDWLTYYAARIAANLN